jgi:hypothetical protein
MTEWVVVLESPVGIATAAWRTWLEEAGLAEADLEPESVRVDTVRAAGGDVRRYSLRRSYLDSIRT